MIAPVAWAPGTAAAACGAERAPVERGPRLSAGSLASEVRRQGARTVRNVGVPRVPRPPVPLACRRAKPARVVNAPLAPRPRAPWARTPAAATLTSLPTHRQRRVVHRWCAAATGRSHGGQARDGGERAAARRTRRRRARRSRSAGRRQRRGRRPAAAIPRSCSTTSKRSAARRRVCRAPRYAALAAGRPFHVATGADRRRQLRCRRALRPDPRGR